MRSFSLVIVCLWAATITAEAGYLPLLRAGVGISGPVVASFVLQTDGVSFILLVDGVSKLQKAAP